MPRHTDSSLRKSGTKALARNFSAAQEEAQIELEYKRSLEPEFFIPAFVASLFLILQSVNPVFSHLKEHLNGIDSFVESYVMGIGLVELALGLQLLILSIVKAKMGYLSSVNMEKVCVITACFKVFTTSFGSQYFIAKVSGEHIPQDLLDNQVLTALSLCGWTALICFILPIRFHIACVVPCLSMFLYVLQMCVSGTDNTDSLVPTFVSLAVLQLSALYVSHIHEEHDRARWHAERKIKTLERLAKGVDTDAHASEEDAEKLRLETEVIRMLPALPRICILGGTAFKEASSELLVKALAQKFREQLNNHVVVLTGGMPGVQQTFAQTLGSNFKTQAHLLPEGNASKFDVGTDIQCGHDLPTRMQVFAKVGHIYICIEGGPGVAKEAKQAFEHDALVLPLISTGGASSGMFGFPEQALKKPDHVRDEVWSQMQLQGDPEANASAVVQAISDFAEAWAKTNNNESYCQHVTL